MGSSARSTETLDAGPCVVRRYRPDDIAALVAHANNAAIARNLRDRFPHPYTRDDALAWIEIATSADPPVYFAIDVAGEAVGGIGYERGSDVERFAAEIGYWIGEPFWGRGLATAALRAVTDWIFETTDIERLFAPVFASNRASCRVLEKCGYVREGVLRRAIFKDGAFSDACLYARLR